MKLFESEKGQKVWRIIKLVVIILTVLVLIALGLYMLLRRNTRPEYSPAVTRELLEMKIGSLQLGQTDTEVRAILGEPELEAVSDDGSLFRSYPSYGAELRFRDSGSGYRLDEITALEGCGWKLPNGVGIGTEGKEVDRICEDWVVTKEQSPDGTAGYTVYSRRSGDLSLSVIIERGKVISFGLSGFFPKTK